MAHTPDMHQSLGNSAAGAANPQLAEALSKGYEPHDISLGGVFLFIVALVLTMMVVILLMYGVMNLFVEHDRASDPVGSPVVIEPREAPHPLQPSPSHDVVDRIDMQTMREQTQAALNADGVSPAGRRYISIEQAMNQVIAMIPKASGSNSGSAPQ